VKTFFMRFINSYNKDVAESQPKPAAVVLVPFREDRHCRIKKVEQDIHIA